MSATRPRPAITVLCSLSPHPKNRKISNIWILSLQLTYFCWCSARSKANVITVIIITVEVSSVQRNVYVLVDKSWSVSLSNKDIRESGFRNPRNFRLSRIPNTAQGIWNPWNPVFLESGLQLKESGIAFASGIRNPKLHWQNPESNTWNPGKKKRFKPVKATSLASCFSDYLWLIKTISIQAD